MKNRYNELFDRVNPPKTDDDLFRAVIAEKNSGLTPETPEQPAPRRRVFKRPAVVLAAAAVTVSAGVTAAGASVGWDFSKLFDQFYSDRAALLNSPSEYDLNFDEMGIQLSKTFDLGCGTAEIHGAIGDTNVLMLIYDLTADDEVKRFAQDNSVDESSVHLRLNCRNVGTTVISDKNEPLNCSWERYCSKEILNGSSILRCTDFYFSDIPLNGGTWHIRYDTLSLYGGGNRKDIHLENPVELDIPLDFISLDCIEIDPDTQVQIDNDILHVTSMVITPLAVSWDQRYVRSADVYSDSATPLVIHFRDGTEVVNYERISSVDESGIEVSSARVMLKTPIKVSEVSAITLGDLTIEVN